MAHQLLLERSPLVPKRLLEVMLWTCISIAILCTFIRLSARLWKSPTLRPDITFLAISSAFLIASGACYQSMIGIMYASTENVIGDTEMSEEGLLARDSFLKLQFASITLIYSTLLTVKVSFLLLSRARGRISKIYDMSWWFTLGFIFLSWVGSMVSLPIFGEPFAYGAANSLLPWFRCSSVLDVIGDFMVLALFISFCWKFRGERCRTVAIGGLFILVVAVALATISRVCIGGTTEVGPEPSWLALCSIIEASLAVCACCLATYIGLFIDSTGFCEKVWAKPDPEKVNRRPRFPGAIHRNMYKSGTHTSAFFHARESKEVKDLLKSPIPSDAVKVRTELVVENEPGPVSMRSPPATVPFRAPPAPVSTRSPSAARPRRASESRSRPAPVHDSYVRTYPGREPFVYPRKGGPAARHRPSQSWQSSTNMVARLEQPRMIPSAALRTSTPPFKFGQNGFQPR